MPHLRLGHPLKGAHPLQNPRSRPGFALMVEGRASGGKQHFEVIKLMVPKPGLRQAAKSPVLTRRLADHVSALPY